MKHPVKPRCKYKCRFLQISDELWLCPHTAWGATSDLLGAVDEARRLLERAGGYDKLRAELDDAEAKVKLERKEARAKAQERADRSLRYA